MNNSQQQKIGFIGAGNMASSLIAGLLDSGHDKTCIKISEPNASKREKMARLGVASLPHNQAVAQWADTVILAVKPQIMKTVVKAIASASTPDQPVIISIAAGISTESILRWLGHAAPVIRVMPNTPAQIGQGMSALFASATASERQKQGAQHILQAVGDTLWLEHESQMDLVTAISGSGPAYFFLFMETLIRAACESGMAESMAKKLVLQTALGAATMAAAEHDPQGLRTQVTSPGGTTEQAIEVFLDGQLAALSAKAVKAAARRSAELSTELREND